MNNDIINEDKIKGLCKEIIIFCDNEQNKQSIPKLEREKISNLRLQKILYFLYGYYWKETKKEILPIEFEAWQYGPVVKEIYSFVKDHGSSQITDKKFKNYNFQDFDQKVFEKVLNHLNQFSTIRLVNASHESDPWIKTSNHKVINNKAIKKWFEKYVPEI